jgi:hypothetical protein
MVHSPYPGLAPWALLRRPFRALWRTPRTQGSRPGLCCAALSGLYGALPVPRAHALGFAVPPFQGSMAHSPYPGLTPWALLCRPFRAGVPGALGVSCSENWWALSELAVPAKSPWQVLKIDPPFQG